jgi:hypothetical protein
MSTFYIVPKAPEDVEMEDLNFYYANYSRIVSLSLAWFHPARVLMLHVDHSIMMSLPSAVALAICMFSLPHTVQYFDTFTSKDKIVFIPCSITVRQNITSM